MDELKMPPEIKPIYCDEFRINTMIKINVDEKNKLRKQGHIDIIFFDNPTKTVVDRIILNPITALQLAQALLQNVDGYDKGMERKEEIDDLKKMVDDKRKEQEPKPLRQTYIG